MCATGTMSVQAALTMPAGGAGAGGRVAGQEGVGRALGAKKVICLCRMRDPSLFSTIKFGFAAEAGASPGKPATAPAGSGRHTGTSPRAPPPPPPPPTTLAHQLPAWPPAAARPAASGWPLPARPCRWRAGAQERWRRRPHGWPHQAAIASAAAAAQQAPLPCSRAGWGAPRCLHASAWLPPLAPGAWAQRSEGRRAGGGQQAKGRRRKGAGAAERAWVSKPGSLVGFPGSSSAGPPAARLRRGFRRADTTGSTLHTSWLSTRHDRDE